MVYKKGELVFSIAGHDAGNAYIILEDLGDYLKLADGRLRKVKKPKFKNKKHVQLTHKQLSEICIKIEEGRIADADIVYAIRVLKGECNV